MPHTTWKGYVSFGLVSVPVKLAVAAKREAIQFNELRESDLSRVGRQKIAKADGAVLDESQIVKGYEFENGRFVTISKEELEKAAPESSRTMEIDSFVDLSSIDPIYLESSYFVYPDEGDKKAPNKGATKAYALLYQVLKSEHKAATAKFVSSHHEHIVVIRPGETGLLMHTLFYKHEVRTADEYRADTSLLSEGEQKLAGTLVEALVDEFQPEKYVDQYRANLLALIDAKKDGAAAPTLTVVPKKNAASDLNAALTASLEAMKAKKGKAA